MAVGLAIGVLVSLRTADDASSYMLGHEHTPPGRFIGQPGYEERYRQWSMYAFDTTETPADGTRSGEWTAVGRSGVHCLRVMARCLAELKVGRWPR